jgi:glycerophosphoryl diester phosphodiesterase
MKLISSFTAVVALLLGCASVKAVNLPRAGTECNQVPETDRWLIAGTPDVGAQPPLLSAHRGGSTLAPENTIWAYRHAFAYGMDFVEIDVRETLDGVFVSMHDDTVDRTTNGSGPIAGMTWAQIEALNAADFIPWQGSQYDPARVPRLEEILALARDSGKGIEFDIKAVRNFPAFFDLVASYGVMSRSYFAISGDDVSLAQAYNPEIRAIFNIEGTESPDLLYQETRRTAVYGSRRDKFTPEKIAAIHDGCSVVIPHSYDNTILDEAEEFRRGRAAGTDGAQIDQPDVIAQVAERRVPAELIYEAASRRVCLHNASNDLGIPRRLLSIFRGIRLPSVRVTDKEGCVSLPQERGEYWIVHFSTAAVREATLQVRID